ncbi:MAG: RNA polymerase sigma-70 factor [Chitinophagaceae bacterium]
MSQIEEHIEQDLLLKVADGSEAAFSRLYHAYRDKLFSFIFGISGSTQLAEDTVQEVFLKIWLRRSEAKYIREFDSYLFRMARNQTLNALKRMAKETLIYQEIEQQSDHTTEISQALEYREIQTSVQDAIEKLPSRQKEVFILSREYGLKQAEISRLLQITVPTVKSHFTQAMHFIRKQCKNIYPIIKIYVILLAAFPY